MYIILILMRCIFLHILFLLAVYSYTSSAASSFFVSFKVIFT